MAKEYFLQTTAFFFLGLWYLGFGDALEGGGYPPPSLDEARTFLDAYNMESPLVQQAGVRAAWTYQRNLTEENSKLNAQESLKSSIFSKEASENARIFDNVVHTFPEDIRRQLAFIRDIGVSALDNDTLQEFHGLKSKMRKNYSTAKLCRPSNTSDCLKLNPGLQEIMAKSRDWDERLWVWKGFRDNVGVANKPLYSRYVDIVNQAARANGYDDRGHDWRYYYGDDVEQKVYELYDAILPLYKQLHAYVRRRLHRVYGDNIDVKGYLPASVLGDMWGRFWVNIYPMVTPYPDRPNIDVTDTMVKQDINATQIFRLANEFFTSLGMISVNEGFWENSQFVRPDDGREVVCHPSAWNFGTGDDFRIAMCTQTTMDDFLIAHHEMGHVQYYMQYKDLPSALRGGANGAFHEAIGEVMSLSVATPKHLHQIGLLEELDEGDNESQINFLLRMSLQTIATLPFSLSLSQWRWDLMRGQYHVYDSMDVWWNIKNNLVGVDAPVERTNQDFDPGAMFHFVIDYPFIGYYIRTIIQFQFYQALCEAANHTGPLHTCDFYNSQEAGQKLADMLSMGRSKPWPDAMEAQN